MRFFLVLTENTIFFVLTFSFDGKQDFLVLTRKRDYLVFAGKHDFTILVKNVIFFILDHREL